MKELFDFMIDEEIEHLGESYAPLMVTMIPIMLIFVAAFIIEGIRWIWGC